MAEQIEKMSHFVAETQWEEIPDAVKQHAKLVMLDTLGVILAGAEQPEVRKLREGLCATAGTGATVLARGWPISDPSTAALLNATAGRSIELCEGHYIGCQGAVQILPGVLAVGERAQSTGREILTALILGYDVAVRFCAARTLRPLSHSNGHATLLGAVAAGARLRGLNAAETSRALRIGATLMLTPSLTNAGAGGTALNVAGGMSGFAGVLAPELALAGFTAHDNAIEESLSSLVGNGFQPQGLLDELGTRWEITGNRFRLRACCNPIYGALDALEDALAVLRPRPEEIESIDVETYHFASLMGNQDPPNYFAAKYSLPHAAAALVLKQDLGYASFTEAAVHDPAIAALRHRVQMTEDVAMSTEVPRIGVGTGGGGMPANLAMSAIVTRVKPARVILTLKDGRQSTQTCEIPRRDVQQPYQESDIREKFRELAGLVLSSAGVSAIENTVNHCEQWASALELTDELRRYDRQ